MALPRLLSGRAELLPSLSARPTLYPLYPHGTAVCASDVAIFPMLHGVVIGQSFCPPRASPIRLFPDETLCTGPNAPQRELRPNGVLTASFSDVDPHRKWHVWRTHRESDATG